MDIKTLQNFELGNISVSNKNVSGDHYRGYFDILSDGKPIVFALSPKFLKTERGIYSEFVRPCKALQCELDEYSDLFKKYGNPIKKGKSSYLDLVLDTNHDNDLYNALLKFEDELMEKLVPCLKGSDGSLKEYISRNCRTDSKIRGEILMGFLKENYSKNNVKYVHLKVTKSTKSFDVEHQCIESDLLCYKSYMIMPIVKVDNVRIPMSRSENVRLNVHLSIEEQIVKSCVENSGSYFESLSRLVGE